VATASSQKGQRVRGALVLGALVTLVSAVALVGTGSPAHAAGLCSSVTYKSGSATVNVDPCQGLNDGDPVHVTGSGFTANGDVTFFMCKAEPASSNDCDEANGALTTADGSGAIDDTFGVQKTFTTKGSQSIDCNNGATPNCSVLLANGDTDADGSGAFMDVGFGTPPSSTTSTTGGSTTTTTGGSTTTTSSTGSTTSTTSAPATCPTGGATTSPLVNVSPLQTTPGSTVTVTGSGFSANAPVNINLCSTPLQLSTAVIDGSGNLATVVTIPASAAAGTHLIVVQPTNGSTAGVGSITLVSAAVTPTPVATPTEATPTFTG